METKIIKTENSVTTAVVKVDGDAWKNKQEKALKKLAQKVQIKGFRKGEAPLELAKKYISQYQIIEEAARLFLDEGLQEAIKQNNIQFYAVRNVSVTKISVDELEVTYNIVVAPHITLGQYKGLNIAEEKAKVTKEDVKAAIDKLLENEAELVLKDGPAAKGDTVVLDFKGYIDGKEFDGGSANNYELVLGSNQFIPGFEDQLVGVKSEDKVDVNVTFPEQYIKDYAGKAAKFACKIHEIKTKQLPVLNDEFAASLDYEGVKTVKDLEEYEKKQLLSQKERQAHEVLFRNIIETIIKGCKYDIADEVINDEAKTMKDSLIKQIENNGLTFEQYKEMSGLDDKAIDEQYFAEAKRRLVEYLTIVAIGSQEKITLTPEELEKYYENTANQYHMEVSKVKEIFAKSENRIRQNLIQNKVEQFIIDSNIKVETKENAKPETAKKTTKKSTKTAAAKKEEVKEEVKEETK